jgi:hypothetical protein
MLFKKKTRLDELRVKLGLLLLRHRSPLSSPPVVAFAAETSSIDLAIAFDVGNHA